MRIYPTLLAALLLGFSSTAISGSPKTKTIETSNGPITFKTETVEPTPQTITIASLKQVAAINKLVFEAKNFVAAYLPAVSNPSLKDCDEAFLKWQREKNRRYTDKQVVEMLGAYLGNQLISDFQMEWVVVSDQYGTDFAVRAKKYEVMSYPFSSVSKRVEKNQFDFMVGIYEIIKHTIASGDYKTR